MLIALVAKYGLQIHQNGCENIFFKWKIGGRNLHGTIRGFVVPSKEKKVCKLVKSLCGLKTSSQIMTCEV